MRLVAIFKNDRLCKALTGVSIVEFHRLLPTFEQALLTHRKELTPDRKRKLGGGKKGALPTLPHKLASILIYLKCYPTFDLFGFLTNRDRSRACRSVRFLLPVLEITLGRELVLPKRQIHSVEEFLTLFPEAKDVFLDGTERRVEKPKKLKKRNKLYSGKKKAPTRKTVVMNDDKRRIMLLTKTKSGRRHDKRLADKEAVIQIIPERVTLWTDTGFQGAKQLHINTVMPEKASKNKPLTLQQKQNNRIISGIRVLSEHAIGGIKRFKAASDVYRNKLPNLDDTFTLLSAGLWNWHLRQTI